MTLSAALGNAGAKHSIEFRGRRYDASLVAQRMKTGMTRWLQAQAYAPVLAMEQAGASQDAVDRAAERFAARCRAREFEFDGPAVARLLSKESPDPDALLAFIALVFGCDADTALAMVAEKPTEVKLILELVSLESFGPPADRGAADAGRSPSSTSSPT